MSPAAPHTLRQQVAELTQKCASVKQQIAEAQVILADEAVSKPSGWVRRSVLCWDLVGVLVIVLLGLGGYYTVMSQEGKQVAEAAIQRQTAAEEVSSLEQRITSVSQHVQELEQAVKAEDALLAHVREMVQSMDKPGQDIPFRGKEIPDWLRLGQAACQVGEKEAARWAIHQLDQFIGDHQNFQQVVEASSARKLLEDYACRELFMEHSGGGQAR